MHIHELADCCTFDEMCIRDRDYAGRFVSEFLGSCPLMEVKK